MDNKRIWPEIVISGFLHLVWIVILLINCTHGSITDIFNSIIKLQTGPFAVIASLVIGGSFLIGLLTNRIFVFISEIYGKICSKICSKKFTKPASDDDLLIALKNAPHLATALEDRSAHKAIFRSAIVSIPLITLTLLPWANGQTNPSVVSVIAITGAVLMILFTIAFITQRKFHLRLLEAMLKYQQESNHSDIG
jgi:hypothetical protein